MIVEQLSLVDFRNYAAADVALRPGPNVFVGRNGQGKTNLAEAIAYFATLGSHRVSQDAPMVREGKDVTLLTYSRMRHHCQAAVKPLVEQGYDPELIDLISLKPFDVEAIKRSIAKTHRVVIVEECMKTGGIGAELIALITEQCFDELDAPPIRLSSQDIPTPYNGKLENLTIIQPHQIVETVQQLVQR